MIKEKNTTPTSNLENFIENIDQITETYSVTQDKKQDDIQIRNKVNETINKYASIEQIPFDFATIGMCALFQSGAYLKSVPNRKITINNHEFTKKSLIFAAEQVDNKFTLRAMARHLNKTIAKIAYKYDIPGHLYARFRIENANLIAQNDPETNKTIATYCADFQIENPDTPSVVREYLSNREKNRTTKNTNK